MKIKMKDWAPSLQVRQVGSRRSRCPWRSAGQQRPGMRRRSRVQPTETPAAPSATAPTALPATSAGTPRARSPAQHAIHPSSTHALSAAKSSSMYLKRCLPAAATEEHLTNPQTPQAMSGMGKCQVTPPQYSDCIEGSYGVSAQYLSRVNCF